MKKVEIGGERKETAEKEVDKGESRDGRILMLTLNLEPQAIRASLEN